MNKLKNDGEELTIQTTSVKVISSLLRHYPIVLVSESGKLIGLITKADLLSKLYKG